MKFLYSVLLITLFLYFGCSNEEKKDPVLTGDKIFEIDTSDIASIPIEIDSNQTFLLRYDFIKGKKYNYRYSTVSKNERTIIGEDTLKINSEQTAVYLIEFLLNNKIDDSTLLIDVTYKEIKVDVNMNGEKYSYISTNKTGNNIEQFGEFEAMLNNTFSVLLNTKGEVKEISNVSGIINKLLTNEGIIDSVTEQQKKQMEMEFAEVSLKKIFIQLFRELPKEEINKNFKWSIKQPVVKMPIFTVNSTVNYNVNNFEKFGEDNLLVYDANVSTVVSDEFKYGDANTKINIEGTNVSGSGRIYFNTSKGCIHKSRINTKVKYTQRTEVKQGNKSVVERVTENMSNTFIWELLN